MEQLDKLLSLQTDYVRLVVDEDRRHTDVLQEYLELVESTKDNIRRESMKFAKSIINDSRFSEAFTTRTVSLYIPILSLLQMMFRGHRHLTNGLLVKEKPSISFCFTLEQVFDHIMLAYDSLCEDLYPDENNDLRSESGTEILYGFEEAMLILDISIKWIKVLLDNDSDLKVSTIIIRNCPRAAVCLTNCSTLIASKDLEKLASQLTRAKEEYSAKMIQNFWRTIIASRKWSKMRKGFRLFQLEYKKRLRAKEVRVLNELDQSEKNFNEMFQLMRQERAETEDAYIKLLQTPAKSVLRLKNEDLFGAKVETRSSEPEDEPDQSKVDEKVERAVLILQCALRRWITKRRRNQVWSLKGMMITSGQPLTEERVRKLQDQIQNWQLKNRVSLNPPEAVMQHTRAQSQLTKYYQSFQSTKKRNQRLAVTLAQTKAIISLLETSPTLQGYTEDQWYQYHSLPLHIAIKARLEHKEALERLKMPRWKRILSDQF